MLLQRRRSAAGVGQCLPCVLCQGVVCLLSIPPTLCVGMLVAIVRNSWPQRSKSRSRGGRSSAQQHNRKTLDSCDDSFATERRLWLHTLLNFFGERALSDVGHLVWRFLDDHPKAVRLLAPGGRNWDVPLRPLLQVSLQQPLPQVEAAAADIQQPLVPPGLLRHGRIAVEADGPDLVVTDLTDQNGSSGIKHVDTSANLLELRNDTSNNGRPRPSLPTAGGTTETRVLRGHQGDVTCFSLGEDLLMVTGSSDTTVRIWDGETCIQTLTSMEWSEWTGTIIMGHVTVVTAVLLHPDGCVISGDLFGAVCKWNRDGSCIMLEPAASSAVRCLAAGCENAMFLAGHESGELRLVALDGLDLLADWRAEGRSSGHVLATTGSGSNGSSVALAACRHGLFQAWHGTTQLSKLASFVEPAISASFDNGGMLIVCGHQRLSLFELDGRLRAVLRAPGVFAAAPLSRSQQLQQQCQRHQQQDYMS